MSKQELEARIAQATERVLDPRIASLAQGQGKLARDARHMLRRDHRRIDAWYLQLQDMEN
jgi:hypothetical protein